MEGGKRVVAFYLLWKRALRALAARPSDRDHEVKEEDYGAIWDFRSTPRDYEFGVPPYRFGEWQ